MQGKKIAQCEAKGAAAQLAASLTSFNGGSMLYMCKTRGRKPHLNWPRMRTHPFAFEQTLIGASPPNPTQLTCVNVYAEVLPQKTRLLPEQLGQQGRHLCLGTILRRVLQSKT